VPVALADTEAESSDDENDSVVPVSSPETDEEPAVEQPAIEVAAAEPALPEPTVDTITTQAADEEANEVSATPALDPLLPESSAETTSACDIVFATTTVELVRFIKLQDFVPCDFNEDGIVDILAFNPRISTGYGFQGIGNGLFEEGPSFDLPFRPSACAAIGDPLENHVILLSREGSLSVFHPLVSSDPPTGLIDVPLSIRPLGDEFSTRFAVIDKENLVCEVYELIGSGVLKLGDYPVESAVAGNDWFEGILEWKTGLEYVPGLPLSQSQEMRIADFNCDGIPDLASVVGHEIVVSLSADRQSLMIEKRVQITGNPQSIRIADIDTNGLPDILVLYGTGILEIITVRAEK
jgi:hypothetical protein